MVAGTAACYTFGIIWYRILTGLGLFASLVACVFPFLIGDLAKILLAALLARRLQAPLIKRGWIL